MWLRKTCRLRDDFKLSRMPPIYQYNIICLQQVRNYPACKNQYENGPAGSIHRIQENFCNGRDTYSMVNAGLSWSAEPLRKFLENRHMHSISSSSIVTPRRRARGAVGDTAQTDAQSGPPTSPPRILAGVLLCSSQVARRCGLERHIDRRDDFK